jgi:hypothetical protein
LPPELWQIGAQAAILDNGRNYAVICRILILGTSTSSHSGRTRKGSQRPASCCRISHCMADMHLQPCLKTSAHCGPSYSFTFCIIA